MKLDLDTLKAIKFAFDIHSDHSTQSNGYRALCNLIDREEENKARGDNFARIAQFLDFTEPNTFYFIQILKRRKENPEMKKDVRVINVYYLYEEGDLDKIKHKIVEDCEKNNARAYINLNRLNSFRIALHTQGIISDYVLKGDYKSVRNAYASACGTFHAEKRKRWLIDIDPEHLPFREQLIDLVLVLVSEIENMYLGEVKTKNGCHLITNPFNVEKFNKMAKEFMGEVPVPTIQKNSPTLLYFIP